MSFSHHFEETSLIPASLESVFNFIDDHSRFSSHMNKSSFMLGGSKMEIQVDEGKGQKVDSHIRMGGKVFGINLFLDEVITLYSPPDWKVWETVGDPKLIVIGSYQMGVELVPENDKSKLKVFIKYNLPTGASKWLGYICGVADHFKKEDSS